MPVMVPLLLSVPIEPAFSIPTPAKRLVLPVMVPLMVPLLVSVPIVPLFATALARALLPLLLMVPLLVSVPSVPLLLY